MPDSENNSEWNVIKSVEQRAKIRTRKATRNSVKNKPIRKQRFGNSFQNADNGMSDDIPTSGEGWTLN